MYLAFAFLLYAFKTIHYYVSLLWNCTHRHLENTEIMIWLFFTRLPLWLGIYKCHLLLSSGYLYHFCHVYRNLPLFFLFTSWHRFSSTLTNISFRTNSMKALPKSYFSPKCLISIWKFEAPATSIRSLHPFLWQIKILKSRWGISICYANLRSVHRPLIHDLWKQLTSSWNCSSLFIQNRHTARAEMCISTLSTSLSLFYSYNLYIITMIILLYL